jgi:hypothetical protein
VNYKENGDKVEKRSGTALPAWGKQPKSLKICNQRKEVAIEGKLTHRAMMIRMV